MNNTKSCRRIIAASVMALMAGAAHGEETRELPLIPPAVSQTIYKGVVGTLLEEVPIDPEKRVDLQRGSAVVSNTLSARSLAVMLGVSNPLFMAIGLAWGVFAASQINAPPAPTPPAGPSPEPAGRATPVHVALAGADAPTHTMLLCTDTEMQPAATASADGSLTSIR